MLLLAADENFNSERRAAAELRCYAPDRFSELVMLMPNGYHLYPLIIRSIALLIAIIIEEPVPAGRG